MSETPIVLKITEQETAYHEAAHAVVAVIAGVLFQVTAIAKNHASLGQLRIPNFEAVHATIDELANGFMDSRRETWHQRHILVAWAGIKAQRRLTGKHDWLTASIDMKTAHQLAACITSSEAEADALLHWLELRADALVNEPAVWATIERVAAQLLEEKVMFEFEVAEAYQQARREHATG